MSTKKYKKLKTADLEKELEQEKKDLAGSVFDVRVGAEKDYAGLKLQKKKIARILTVMKNKK